MDPINHILAKAISQGLLYPLRGRTPVARTFLYADDITVCVAPIKEDISFLASTLATFGDTTGLKTNYQISLVVPIRCEILMMSSYS
jgi:hypothetical protein